MHNRIKDVKSNSDDNGDVVEGKSTDKACLDGIDTRKYANFLTLFNSLKKRNASSLDIDHIQHLASVQQGRSGYRNVSVVENCMPSTSSRRSNAFNQNSNDEHVLESCQISGESRPITLSNMDLTTIPMNFIQKKLELHTDEQTYSTKVPTFCTTSSTNKVRSETFDSLLDFNKRRMQIDKDKSKKIVNGSAPFVQPYRFNNNIAQSSKIIVTSSEIQVPCSSVLFRRSFEFLTRKEKEGIERIEKNAVTRSLSFDAASMTTKRKYFERSPSLDITPIIVQEMDDETLVHINDERADFNLKQSSKKSNSNSNLDSNKEVSSFGEAASIEVENYVDADKLQEIKTLRNINKTLATKLAKAERIAQLLQIQLKFYDKANDAKFACRLADIIDQLKLLLPNDRFRDEALEVLNSANPSISVNDEKFLILNSLLKEIEYNKAALSDSGILRKYCERLIEYARKHPPVLMELQNQINENRIVQLRNNVEHEIMLKNTPNGNIIDGSCENHQRQITSLEANLVLHREQLAMKDVQLRQLEEEIGNAHRCNQQLNAKLGSMATLNSTNFLNQEKELRVSSVLFTIWEII